MADERENEIKQDLTGDEQLLTALLQVSMSEYSRLQEFISLTQLLKAKQDALDIMAADTTPSAIGSSYVADTLEPNSQGDLVTLVAKTPGEQTIIDNIYRRLNLPLEKIVYSLFKNAIVIGEFAHEGDLVSNISQMKSRSAVESQESATEDIKIKVHNSPIMPKIKILSDTTRVFPILQYEEVVGFVEVTLSDWESFDFSKDIISYQDVVIHSAEDYAYVKFGFRTESKPLQLKVRLANDTIVEYDIDQGRSLLEASYPAWTTLSIIKDSVNLARLAYSASSVVVQTEVGNMTEPQIEVARNKLKDLFENRLAFGKNGAKSYLQPQIKPNYIYSFTKNGLGAITTNTIGGDYNPGVLSDLRYFEDEFFGGMGAVKQHYARTEDAGGLDGGGAVEEYEKRYRSYVSQFKRLLGQFIKECINRVLLSRDLRGVYDNFDVIINKAYEEEDLQVVNHQQTKLSFLQQAIDFLEIQDERKVRELKLQALKTVITDKSLLESFSDAVLESKKIEEQAEAGLADEESVEDEGLDDLGGGSISGGGGGDLMGQIDSIGTEDEDLSSDLGDEDIGEEGGDEGSDIEDEGSGEDLELPPVGDMVSEDQVDEE